MTLFQSLLPTPTEQKPRRLMFKVYRHQQNRNPGDSRSKSTTDTYRTETQATHTPQSSTDTNRTETQTNHLQSLPTPTEQKPTRFTFKVHRHQQNRKSLRKNNNNINNNNNKRTETHAAHVQSLLPTPTEQISRRADRTARRHGLTFKVEQADVPLRPPHTAAGGLVPDESGHSQVAVPGQPHAVHSLLVLAAHVAMVTVVRTLLGHLAVGPQLSPVLTPGAGGGVTVEVLLRC